MNKTFYHDHLTLSILVLLHDTPQLHVVKQGQPFPELLSSLICMFPQNAVTVGLLCQQDYKGQGQTPVQLYWGHGQGHMVIKNDVTCKWVTQGEDQLKAICPQLFDPKGIITTSDTKMWLLSQILQVLQLHNT